MMLSAGDPKEGDAGYVALEVLEGTIDGRRGTVMFQQFGTMRSGAAELRYEAIPGSGTGALAGMTGTVALEVVNGLHRVVLEYELPS